MPYPNMTAASTHALAASTARRSGTAATVVRIIPVAYSLTITMAPTLLATSIRMSAAIMVNEAFSAVCTYMDAVSPAVKWS